MASSRCHCISDAPTLELMRRWWGSRGVAGFASRCRAVAVAPWRGRLPGVWGGRSKMASRNRSGNSLGTALQGADLLGVTSGAGETRAESTSIFGATWPNTVAESIGGTSKGTGMPNVLDPSLMLKLHHTPGQ